MGPPPGYSPYGGQAYGQPSTSGKAITALVAGILSVFICGGLIIPSVLGIVFGVLARKEIDASNGLLKGRGMATAGLVLGIVGLAITPFLWWWIASRS
jgi:hypothetical protein